MWEVIEDLIIYLIFSFLTLFFLWVMKMLRDQWQELCGELQEDMQKVRDAWTDFVVSRDGEPLRWRSWSDLKQMWDDFRWYVWLKGFGKAWREGRVTIQVGDTIIRHEEPEPACEDPNPDSSRVQ